MYSQEHRYDVKEFGLSSTQMHHLRKRFAVGSQERVEHKTTPKTAAVCKVPDTWVDAVKQAFCEWAPNLNWGWISPTMRVINHRYTTHEENHYVNIIGLEDLGLDDRGRTSVILQKCLPESYHALDLLEATPPTVDDVIDASVVLGAPSDEVAFLMASQRRKSLQRQ